MKRHQQIKLFLSNLLILWLSSTWAQGDGIVSFIDIEGGGLQFASCLELEPDPRACYPNLATIHLDAFEACIGQSLLNCDHKVVYPVPFEPIAKTDMITEDIDVAWESFVNKTIDEVSQEINALPPCWLPTPCPPKINWNCVMQRVSQALQTAYAEFLPAYWAEVYQSIGSHALLALHWRSAYPNDGAIIIPVFTLEPKPNQYQALVEEPRDAAYYFQPPLFPRVSVPYIPDELNALRGGITELEERKRQLEPATLLEYQQFGFASVFEVYGEVWFGVLFQVVRGPYLVTACLIPVPPFIIPVPVAVPTPVVVPRAFTDIASIPEGYEIGRVKGMPLY